MRGRRRVALPRRAGRASVGRGAHPVRHGLGRAISHAGPLAAAPGSGHEAERIRAGG